MGRWGPGVTACAGHDRLDKKPLTTTQKHPGRSKGVRLTLDSVQRKPNEPICAVGESCFNQHRVFCGDLVVRFVGSQGPPN